MGVGMYDGGVIPGGGGVTADYDTGTDESHNSSTIHHTFSMLAVSLCMHCTQHMKLPTCQ